MGVGQLFVTVLLLTAASFGGGNMILAGLERELVRTGIISPLEFAAAVALGQSTPGPIAAFTTAVGRSVAGVPGAVAATLGLMVVSLSSVMLIRRIPSAWFERQDVRSGLAAVTPYMVAIVFFLAYRIVSSGSMSVWAGPLLIGGIMLAGRLLQVPTAVLMVGCVLLGMLLQGTAIAPW